MLFSIATRGILFRHSHTQATQIRLILQSRKKKKKGIKQEGKWITIRALQFTRAVLQISTNQSASGDVDSSYSSGGLGLTELGRKQRFDQQTQLGRAHFASDTILTVALCQ